jgi:glycosyltransferase involved in cell wall biosynthesis
MRLVHICTSFNAGGIQRHVLQLRESLRAHGHHVFLAGAPGAWLSDTAEPDYLPLDLRAVSTDERGTLARIAQAFSCASALRRFLRRHRIDLIHAHESAPAIVAGIARLGMGLPIVVTYHGSAPERVRSFGRIARLTGRRVVTPSHRCAAELHKQAGVPQARLDVIGLGVDPPPTIPQELVEQHRKRLLGSEGKYLVVTIARLAHQKGLDVLVDVVRRVKAHRSDIRFVVIGDGPLRDEVRGWAARAGVDTLLRFDGQSEHPYRYLRAADLFLLTSRWEALPIAIAEAFQAGVPVVATDAGGAGAGRAGGRPGPRDR